VKALVTGVSGFTGSNLARALQKRGYEVSGLVRESSQLRGFEGMKVTRGGLSDAKAIDSAVRGMDYVFHVAASYQEPGIPDSAYFEANVEGPKRIAEACIELGVKRMVHLSTCGVHGHVEEPPANEEYRFQPGDVYQESKLRGELAVRAYIPKGLKVTIVRPTGIYGPGDKRFLKLFRAVKKGTFVMFGDGNVLYQMVYIDDLVNAIVACAEHDRALGEVFLVASETPRPLNDVVRCVAESVDASPPRIHVPFWILNAASVACEELCKPFGIEPPLYRRRASFFRKARAFDTSKIERELGFRPRVPLETGIRRTADWYREQGLL
jgi:nucleoside-diphosphate-sugar epimerase